MAFTVDEAAVRAVLAPLIGTGGRYASLVGTTLIVERIASAVAEVEQRLSTRFTPTVFIGHMGPASLPAPSPVTPPAEPLEYEGPHQWPNTAPSAGFLAWRMRVRPVLELVSGSLVLPGSFQPGAELNRDWFRVDPLGEITLMPQYGAAALVLPNLPFGLFNWMSQRIPESVLFCYRAGMTAHYWARFPQINELVAIRAAIKLLPVLSLKINPSGLTSESGDGLSISRKSGYVFADLEERLKHEADGIQNEVLDAWDGTSALTVL